MNEFNQVSSKKNSNMKYRFLILIFTLISNSLYSQNEFRIFVGEYYPNSIKEWKNFGPIGSRSVLTINLTDSTIQKDLLVLVSNEHSDIIPIEPIVNNPKILSFKFRDGGNSPYIIDFVFEKKKNLITLTKHTFKFDGTENEPVEKMYYGFTRQQLDDPTNELEVKNSEYYGVRLLREEFYEKVYKTWEGKRFFIREEVEEVIEFYNTHPLLDWDFHVRKDLIRNLSLSYSKGELDTIPINLISNLRNLDLNNLPQLRHNQKIVLSWEQKYGEDWIGYYSSFKDFLSTNGRINDLSNGKVSENPVPQKFYKIRKGSSYTEHKIVSDIIIDTNFIVRTEEKVIDTIMFKSNSYSSGFLVVSLKKEEFFEVSENNYKKKESKYLKPGYEVFEIYNTTMFDSWYRGMIEGIYIRKSKSVWLNDIYVGKIEINEKIHRNELLK